jgi:hypothetical protein
MVLQGGPCGRVDRRRTQFHNKPHLFNQVGLIFLYHFAQNRHKKPAKLNVFRYLSAMENEQSNTQAINLEQVKQQIKSINDLPINQHSDQFEQIHGSLQKALTNLDGV